ncbi:hypothetical protein [Paracraurococcus ruber]|uniref:hypothetical protein n=1 Tax=Paracraurococcus ruber TaxID=77675 RepID=UPI0010578DC1|nr:hypothetical protein [Paracraurococcus ruber]TDG30645.1 hypothetical protein E2C05_13745 [Paracraurococcus ruber]
MNRDIFDRLSTIAEESGFPVPNKDRPRWVNTNNLDDAELLAKAKIVQSLFLTRRIRALLVEHQNIRRFLISDIPALEDESDVFQAEEITGGLFLISISKMNLDPVAPGASIVEAIGSYYQGVSGYDGYNHGLISFLYPPVTSYEVNTAHVFSADLNRIIGSFLCQSTFRWVLPLEDTTLQALRSLFEAGNSQIPYRNVLQGILSIFWHSLYLDLYRCLERLYFIPRVKNLVPYFQNPISPETRIAVLLETHLSWRPREDEALKSLVAKCSEALLRQAMIDWGVIIEPDSNGDPPTLDRISSKLTATIYELRNAIVHFRPIHQTVEKDDATWNRIIRSLIEIICEVYDFFNSEIPRCA